MTEEKRTRVLEHVGAVNLHIDVTTGSIEVRASRAEGDVAQVTLEPVFPGDEVALALIERAEIHMSGSNVRVIVPAPPGSGRRVVYGSHNVVVGNVIGNVVSVGDVYGGIFVGGNGEVRIGSVGGGTVHMGTPGQVRVTAMVPSDSHVTGKTVAGDMSVSTDGEAEFAEVTFTSKNGDLRAVGARRVNAHTVAGDITASGARWMQANSVSGDISAESLAGELNARSVSGDIEVYAVADGSVTASTVSGDVRVTRSSGVNVSVNAGSVSGRVRT
ncbi:DUF4097 family beta strand repeat-containing protein [Actinophytocola sp.]|uniref:DUF4097 family beta strand repeat-containing protein n=1 Tax=Actinophytocola sp. TaxID=1872138 RepID=UPI002D7E7868|nr:DUF4097 family beta strand repeat-containing protein [Actinophytocola sp.]HET9144057.1 DUF4097 family beta strand repeat-containing protein [Actinophytocola sp.]